MHPCDDLSLAGALEARKADLIIIIPILVGPVANIRKAAEQAGKDLADIKLFDAPHSHAAAARQVEALMKVALHTDEVMGAVVHPDTGLRTERRISHIFVLDVPHYSKLLLVTDAAGTSIPTSTTSATSSRMRSTSLTQPILRNRRLPSFPPSKPSTPRSSQQSKLP